VQICEKRSRSHRPPPDVAHASQLLNHHQQMVEQALGLGYRPRGPKRDAIAVHMRDHLGQPAIDMQELLARLSGETAG
jgi:hypothetical protein